MKTTVSEKERIKADYKNSELLREAEAKTGLTPNDLIRESLHHYLDDHHIKELSQEDFSEFKSFADSQTNQKRYFLAMLAKKGELKDILTLEFSKEKEALLNSITNLNSIITEKDLAIETLQKENTDLKNDNEHLKDTITELESEKERLKADALTQAQILSLLKDIHKTQHEEAPEQDNH